MRFKRLFIALALAALIAASGCVTGESPDNDQEPPCDDHIEDEDYHGAYRAIVGMGEGTLAALNLAFDKPGRFNVVVAMNGPTDIQAVLSDIDGHLAAFDDWATPPSRAERIAAYRDWIAAFGNPFYINEDSLFYPPGVDANDFDSGEPVSVPGLVSPDNPDGTIPSVTVYDEDDLPVPYVLAHDLNRNGRRDPGEPLILWLREPFADANENGIHDAGESFQDVGLDGVAGTDDFGEGNGQFDLNPRVAHWLANDPASRLADAPLDLAPGYHESYYLESLRDDPWGYAPQIRDLAAAMGDLLETESEGADAFCITNRLGVYEDFLGDRPIFTNPFWFGEKYVWMDVPGGDADLWDVDEQSISVARIDQALRFVSLRMPNGLDTISKESEAIWQVRDFYSEALAERVSYGVGYPAGYFDQDSNWKTYPIVYVFHDGRSDLGDLRDLLAYQGDLSRRNLAKQAILIVVDGTRDAQDLPGFSHYVDQTAGEFGGAYGRMVEELIAEVETAFRVQTEFHDERD